MENNNDLLAWVQASVVRLQEQHDVALPRELLFLEFDPSGDARVAPIAYVADAFERRFHEVLSGRIPWMNINLAGVYQARYTVCSVELPSVQSQRDWAGGHPTQFNGSGWDAETARHVVTDLPPVV